MSLGDNSRNNNNTNQPHSFAFSAYSMASHHHHQETDGNDNDDANNNSNNININRSTNAGNNNEHNDDDDRLHHEGDDDSESSSQDLLNSTMAQQRQGGKGTFIKLKKTPHPFKKHRCLRYCFCTWRNVFLYFFLFCFIVGVVGFAAGPAIVLALIRETVRIDSPYSPIYKYWLEPDVHGVSTYRRLYLYNVTNPYEIVLHGAQPNIVQIGPFVYREVWQKDPQSIRWFVNGTMGYRYKYFMYFEPGMSVDEVTGEKLTDDKAYNVTILNGPMRGTLFRVGRLPEVVVHISKKFNITRQEVCLLLDVLINNTIVGPKGVFVQRTPHEVFFGYQDPIWSELHEPLLLFDYNASTFFQAQWNGSAVAPSPYTYRSGMMCPLWQVPSDCNNTGSDITLTVSGSAEYKLLDSDIEQRRREATWAAQGVPDWMLRPGGGLLSPDSTQGDITLWAGQLQGQWWWGPMRPGMTGGDEPLPDSINPPHQLSSSSPDLDEVEMNFEEGRKETSSATLNGAKKQKQSEQVQKNINNSSGNNNNNTNNDLFDPNACRKQYGTDGTRFSMPVKNDAILQIFSDFLGRTLPFTYTQETSVSGLATKRFAFNAAYGLRATAANRFCYQQRMDGLINVSQFVFGDGLVSKSGYLDSCVVDTDDMICVDDEMPDDDANDTSAAARDDDGFCGKRIPFNNTFSATFADSLVPSGRLNYDDYLRELVLKDLSIPRGAARRSQQFRDRFESFVDVQPLTGTTLNAQATGLISLVLGPIFTRDCDRYLSNFTRRMPRTLIPYMRLDREARVGGEVLDTLKAKLALMHVAYALCGVALGVGFLGLIGVVLYQKRMFCWKNRETSTSSEDDDER